MKKKENSEFGNGFLFCLALFIKHAERNSLREYYIKEVSELGKSIDDFYFSAACDHLYGIEYPKNIDKFLKIKVEKFIEKCFEYKEYEAFGYIEDEKNGYKNFSKEQEKHIDEVIEECKEIFFLYDRSLGVNPIRGDYE